MKNTKLLFICFLMLIFFKVNAQTEFIKDCRKRMPAPHNWNNYLGKKLSKILNSSLVSGAKTGYYNVTITLIVDTNGKASIKSLYQKNKSYNFVIPCMEIIEDGPLWPIAKDAKGKSVKSLQKTSILFEIDNDDLYIKPEDDKLENF